MLLKQQAEQDLGFVKNIVQGQRRPTLVKLPDGTKESYGNLKRETVSLRYDIMNPKD